MRIKKTLAIIVARSGSKRLKNKIFYEINNTPIIKIIYKKLQNCKNIDKILIATTTSFRDKKVVNFAKKNGIPVYKGSENNVLNRLLNASKFLGKFDIIVRANCDCPLFIEEILEKDILRFRKSKYDLLSPCFDNLDKFSLYPNRYNSKLHAPHKKVTLDTYKDYLKIKKIYNNLKSEKKLKAHQIINIIKKS